MCDQACNNNIYNTISAQKYREQFDNLFKGSNKKSHKKWKLKKFTVQNVHYFEIRGQIF